MAWSNDNDGMTIVTYELKWFAKWTKMVFAHVPIWSFLRAKKNEGTFCLYVCGVECAV